jgi:hypothetical protein
MALDESDSLPDSTDTLTCRVMNPRTRPPPPVSLFDLVLGGQLLCATLSLTLSQLYPPRFECYSLHALVVTGRVHTLTRRIADIPEDYYNYCTYHNDVSGQIVKARTQRSKNARFTKF